MSAKPRGTVYTSTVYRNVSQEIIEITADKLTLILNEHVSTLEARGSWQAPLGVVVTLLIGSLTTATRDALGLSADVWTALFIFATLAAAVWLVRALWRFRRRPTVDDIISKIKDGCQ